MTLEFAGKIVRLDSKGKPDLSFDVRLACPTCPGEQKLNTHPHGMGFGLDGKTLWFTGKSTGTVGRLTPDGKVAEFPIPTHNSRPIAIVPEPGSNAMWFSEEAGNRVARITPDGTITEYPVPMMQPNVILAGLAFDSEKNPTPASPSPAGGDYIIRIDKSILTTRPADISKVPMTFYKVPTSQTVMHRIVQGPDKNIWFTELGSNKVGKLFTGP